ncbi:hypothetical protein MKW92_001577 [Papaver armeniacum]|nr:hypothetical protein MKW92_001577 [Papaver armeniacum]
MDQWEKILDLDDQNDPTDHTIPQSSNNLQKKLKEFDEFYSSQHVELKLGINIKTLEETKEKLTSETESLDNQIRTLRSEIDFLHRHKSEEIEFLYKEKLDLEIDLELLRKQKEELTRSDLDSLNVEKAILNKKKLKLRRDVELLSKRKTKLGADIESLNSEKAVLESDIGSLKNEKTAVGNDICLLNKRKIVLESDIQLDEKKKSDLGRELELFSKDKEKQQCDFESVKKAMSTAGRDLESLGKQKINRLAGQTEVWTPEWDKGSHERNY